jgi:RNA polymerase sigma-70 factor (ECF subfamily)
VSAAEPRLAADSPALDAEHLFNEYSASVYRYCLGRLNSPEEAEDAVQVTYLNAWRSLRSGTRPAEPRSWLFTIAANVCVTAMRTRLRGARVEVRDPEDFERLPSAGAPADELVDLDAALHVLPTRQRQALLLRDWRGLSYEEIASQLDASQSAVETLLFRARRALVASLATPALRIRRVPLRSGLSALVPWPSALSEFKSSLMGTSATTKVALKIAVGATAPLVAFGVAESTVISGNASPTSRDAAVVESRFDIPRGVWGPVPSSSDKTPGPAALVVGNSEPPKPASGKPTPPPSEPGPQAAGAGGATAGPHAAGTGGGASAAEPTSSTEPSQSSSAPSEPPAEVPAAPAAGALVVICHTTGSQKNAAVTISVDAAAVEYLLAQGDQLGACAS